MSHLRRTLNLDHQRNAVFAWPGTRSYKFINMILRAEKMNLIIVMSSKGGISLDHNKPRAATIKFVHE